MKSRLFITKTKVFGSSIETLREEIDRESENYNCIQLGLNQRRSWRNRIMSAVQSTTLPWMLKKKHLLGNSVPEKKQFFKNIPSSPNCIGGTLLLKLKIWVEGFLKNHREI